MITRFQCYLDPRSSPQYLEINVVRVGPTLTKLSGSAHDPSYAARENALEELTCLKINPHIFSDKNSQMQHNMTFFSMLLFKCFVDDIVLLKLCKLLTQGLVTCIDLEISMIVLTLNMFEIHAKPINGLAYDSSDAEPQQFHLFRKSNYPLLTICASCSVSFSINYFCTYIHFDSII